MGGADVRVITGPTAAGKSGLALALAERHGAIIVSADSRQIYRGFDIGTAKPSASERALVRHVGIDVAEPGERYSAAAWASLAADALQSATAANTPIVVVGGTGFYLRALFSPLFEEPKLDAARRASLERFLATLPLAELRRWCVVLDAPRSHLGRAQLSRALEVALLTGQRLSTLHRIATRPARYRARYLVVDPGSALRARIEFRVDAMLRAGWIGEVRQLMGSVPAGAPAWNAAGYEALRVAARGELTLDEARSRVVIETRQYAKRQRTWLRHQLDPAQVRLLDPEVPDAMDRAERWWGGQSA